MVQSTKHSRSQHTVHEQLYQVQVSQWETSPGFCTKNDVGKSLWSIYQHIAWHRANMVYRSIVQTIELPRYTLEGTLTLVFMGVSTHGASGSVGSMGSTWICLVFLLTFWLRGLKLLCHEATIGKCFSVMLHQLHLLEPPFQISSRSWKRFVLAFRMKSKHSHKRSHKCDSPLASIKTRHINVEIPIVSKRLQCHSFL